MSDLTRRIKELIYQGLRNIGISPVGSAFHDHLRLDTLLPGIASRRRFIRGVILALYAQESIKPSAIQIETWARKSLRIADLAILIADGYEANTLSDRRGGFYRRNLHKMRPPQHGRLGLPSRSSSEGVLRRSGTHARLARKQAIRSSRPTAHAPVPADPDVGFSLVKIFYATDRAKLTTKPGKVLDYGARRADGLQLGECEISIPARHKAGSVERPKWWKFEFAEDPEKHVTLRDVTELGDDAFYKRASEVIAKSERKEAFVFVHGYNVKFASAARQTAQMAFDLRFDGAPILYSWPSQGTMPGYVVDANTIIWTQPHLVDFLTDVATRTGATRVHVIAHSMGNRAVCNALEALSHRATPNLHHVVLTAPDVDADVFRNVVKGFQNLPKTITLYASSKDKAIQASKTINGAPRAGEPIVILPGIDSIDASNVETDFLAHGYFSGTRSVLSDIYNLLRDQPAKSRFDLIPSKHQDGDYFSFKP